MKKPSLTYYRVPNPHVSFHGIANHYIAELKNLGFDVTVSDLDFNRTSFQSGKKTDIGLVHPLFYFSAWKDLEFENILGGLKKYHQKLVGLEVADTTAVSNRFVSWANHDLLNGLVVPSHFSKEAFVKSGVVKTITVVPHGVSLTKASDKFDFLKKENGPIALTFVLNEPVRKGFDLFLELSQLFPEVLFVVKGLPGKSQPMIREGNVMAIQEWLTPEDRASLYENADVYISLHRGGAFELNCLEALCYGLSLLATRAGSILDYCNDENAHLVSVDQWAPLYGPQNDHCGMGATANRDEAVQKLKNILANLPVQKQKIKTDHTWNQVTQKLANYLESL